MEQVFVRKFEDGLYLPIPQNAAENNVKEGDKFEIVVVQGAIIYKKPEVKTIFAKK